MSMSLDNLIVGRQEVPIRISLYGTDGIGKSTWAAMAPKPIFIGAEDGTSHLDVTRFPKPESWTDILDAITELYEKEHDFKTVVLDTADWAEKKAADQVCNEHNVNSLEEISYGKWKRFLLDTFSQCLRGFDALYGKGMNIILISHCEVKTFNDPEHESYDRYQLKLHESIAATVREWCDVNLFANYDTSVQKVGQGFNEKTKAVSYGKRMIFTERSAAFDAKNRYNLPNRLPLEFDAFWEAYQAYYAKPETNPKTK